MRSTGQNWQPGAGAAAALDTPPPSRIIMQETGTSVISSLSTSPNSRTNAHTASASCYTQLNDDNVDLFDSSDEKDTPSPKKALPDFTAQKSDDDSLVSGDDSAGWDREEA
jgi:hypothetical protein